MNVLIIKELYAIYIARIVRMAELMRLNWINFHGTLFPMYVYSRSIYIIYVYIRRKYNMYNYYMYYTFTLSPLPFCLSFSHSSVVYYQRFRAV